MRARLVLIALVLLAALPAPAQQSPLTRDQTRELLRASLERYGSLPDVNVTFRQSEKQPYNFIGIMTAGLKNSQELEVVIGVSDKNTISLHVYPHYKGGYINLEKASDRAGLMRGLQSAPLPAVSSRAPFSHLRLEIIILDPHPRQAGYFLRMLHPQFASMSL